MERIIIVRRESKKDGKINLRFRLRDGRGVDLFHKTDIKAELKDLAKFNEDGSLRGKVSIFNQKLKESIDQELALKRRPIVTCAKDRKRLTYRVLCWTRK